MLIVKNVISYTLNVATTLLRLTEIKILYTFSPERSKVFTI